MSKTSVQHVSTARPRFCCSYFVFHSRKVFLAERSVLSVFQTSNLSVKLGAFSFFPVLQLGSRAVLTATYKTADLFVKVR